MSTRVTNSIASKNDHIRKGLNTVMGGQVLEHEGKRIFNEGRAAGIEEGKTNGAMIEKEIMSINLYKHGVPVETIAESANVSSNLFKQWIESAVRRTQTM